MTDASNPLGPNPLELAMMAGFLLSIIAAMFLYLAWKGGSISRGRLALGIVLLLFPFGGVVVLPFAFAWFRSARPGKGHVNRGERQRV